MKISNLKPFHDAFHHDLVACEHNQDLLLCCFVDDAVMHTSLSVAIFTASLLSNISLQQERTNHTTNTNLR